MKISIGETIMISNNIDWGPNFWEMSFEEGVVEGGSSGAPLLNENGLLIGQHSGRWVPNLLTCINPNAPAFSGRFDVSWGRDNNGDFLPGRNATNSLAPWLDPNNTNAMTTNTIPIPTISGPDYLCSTSTFTLQNAPAGSTVSWSVSPTHLFSGSTSGSGASASLSPASWASSGQATLTFSIDGGCGVIESSTDFWVGRAVSNINGPYDMAVNTIENYFATGEPYMGITDYQWSVSPSGNEWIGNQGTNGITLTISSGGLYSLGLDVVNPCGARGSETSIYVYNPWEHFTLYPNPTSDILHISLDIEDRGNSGDQDFVVSLFDSRGQEIISGRQASQQTSLDLSGIPKGFYYVHIRYKDALIRRQIKVER